MNASIFFKSRPRPIRLDQVGKLRLCRLEVCCATKGLKS
jgi:hypothetical protein